MAGLPKGRGRKGGIPKQNIQEFSLLQILLCHLQLLCNHLEFLLYLTLSLVQLQFLFKTEQCLGSGLSRPTTAAATIAPVSAQVGNNFSSFSNSQLQPLIVNASRRTLVQSQSLVDSVSNTVIG